MISLLLLLFLAQDPCDDRRPGLSKCVEYEVTCRAACYYGRRPDGGTYGVTVRATAKTQDACRAELEKQAANGCKP